MRRSGKIPYKMMLDKIKTTSDRIRCIYGELCRIHVMFRLLRALRHHSADIATVCAMALQIHCLCWSLRCWCGRCLATDRCCCICTDASSGHCLANVPGLHLIFIVLLYETRERSTIFYWTAARNTNKHRAQQQQLLRCQENFTL